MSGESGHPKLARPNIEGACERLRLFEALDRARDRPIVWISGPAGSGKSTLVSSYCRARELDCIWYDVDERDRDVASLFYYLGLAAGADRAEGASGAALPVLTADHPVGSLAFARRYFESLFERLARPTLIVFDNCQIMSQGERWYDLLREGISAVRPGLNLVFISRVGPVPVFARFLAASRLALIGWEELRFSREETRELVEERSRVLGLSSSTDHTGELYELSDGWAAGIVLALECARFEQKRPADGARASPHFFDYFATEVLAQAEPKLRRFLISSAFLPNMTPQALDRLLGGHDSARLLTRLKNDNFFLSEYAANPPVYRYHPLFRDFLLAQAPSALDQPELDRLRQDAAKLLAAQGETDAALELLSLTGDHDSAAGLITSEAPRLFAQGRTHTVAEWVRKLPQHVVAENAWLALWAGVANLGTAPGLAKHWLGIALESFEASDDAEGFWSAWCAIVQAQLLEGNDVRPLKPLLEQAVSAEQRGRKASLPGLEGRVVRSMALSTLLYAPEEPHSPWIERALSLPRGRDPEELMLAVLVYGWPGQLRELDAVIEAWRRRAAREKLGSMDALSLCMTETVHALFSGEFLRCQEEIRKGLELVERAGIFALSTSFRVYHAYVQLAVGETGTLALVVDEMAQDAESGRLLDIANYHFISGYEALLLGDLPRARRQMQISVDDVERLGAPTGSCVHGIGLAEILWHSGEPEAAKERLALLKPRAAALSQIMLQGVMLLEAAMLRSEHERKCDEALAEAFALGRSHGFVPVPWPVRPVLKELCRRAELRGIERDYVRELAAKFAFESRTTGRPSSSERVRSANPLPTEFSKAVRQALRRLHETGRLAHNPLISSPLVSERTGAHRTIQASVEALQALLRESVAALAQSARTEPAHRALFYTYLEPMATQLLAAEAAKMSFGSYRRHLAAGLDELTASLWLREQTHRG